METDSLQLTSETGQRYETTFWFMEMRQTSNQGCKAPYLIWLTESLVRKRG